MCGANQRLKPYSYLAQQTLGGLGGGVANAQWHMKWMTFPPAGAACRAAIKCGCTQGCRGQCKCKKADLTCTMLCKCGGC